MTMRSITQSDTTVTLNCIYDTTPCGSLLTFPLGGVYPLFATMVKAKANILVANSIRDANYLPSG